MKIGDKVRVLAIPDELLRDIPEDELDYLRGQAGKIVEVRELLGHRYLWLSFADGSEGFSLQPCDVQLVQAGADST